MSTPELPPQEKLARLAEVTNAKVSSDPDPNTLKESATLQNERFRSETSGQKQNITERKKYAQLFFCLSCAWLVGITGILMLQGFGSRGKVPFELSDSIVLTMIGSTTVNVLGILYIVAKYLFPNRGWGDDNTSDSSKSS